MKRLSMDDEIANKVGQVLSDPAIDPRDIDMAVAAATMFPAFIRAVENLNSQKTDAFDSIKIMVLAFATLLATIGCQPWLTSDDISFIRKGVPETFKLMFQHKFDEAIKFAEAKKRKS